MTAWEAWALAVVVGTAPAVFLLSFFYLKDRYEPEPLRHIAMAFGLGLYAMIAARGMAAALAELVSRDWLALGGERARLFDAFVLAAAVEELAKWVIIVTAVFHWDEFDEPLDGVVYGVAVALGFATLENILYIASRGLGVAWGRAIFAVPAHALFGGTMGYYAGRAKFARAAARRAALWRDRVFCLALPVLFHGTYNYALHHRLNVRVYAAVSAISIALWAFVLRRVHRAQRASPYRPRSETTGS
jgi:RsiW-degrading membrane proteinase PrsW (M82 family)